MLSPLDELLWAVIGLLLTVSGVFIEVSIPLPALAWQTDWSQLNTYSLGATLQIGAVLMVGCLGGRNAAALSQIAYLALGLGGAQVFVFTQGGGLSYLQEPTFGYLLGFVPGAWFCGTIAFQQPRRFESIVIGCFVGLFAIHLLGILYLSGLSIFGVLASSWWSNIWQYSIVPLPGQFLILCAVALTAFGVRRLLFY